MNNKNKVVVRPLITCIGFVVVLQILNRVLPSVMDPVAGEAAGFMTSFASILLGAIFFLAFVAANINGKIPRKLHTVVELIIVFFLVAGVVCMFQPIAIEIYSTGFNILIFAMLAFMIWGHLIPKMPSQEAEEAGTVGNDAEQAA